MARTFSCQAIILKSINLRELDRIYTIFSLKLGKSSVLAKGVRKVTSRRSGALQPFNQVKLLLVKTKGLSLVTDAELINQFGKIGKNLKTTSQAYYFCELVNLLTPYDQPAQPVWHTLVDFLNLLDKKGPIIDSALFEWVKKLTQVSGFGPPAKVKTLTQLEKYLESVVERKLKSKSLLKNLPQSLK